MAAGWAKGVGGGDVDVADILRVEAGNAETARSTTVALVKSRPAICPASLMEMVLDTALITAAAFRDYTRFDAICGRVLTRRG